MTTSPLVATAAAANEAISMRSGNTRWLAPCSASTPSTMMRRSTSTEMTAPICCRNRMRSITSGSVAAFSMTVVPWPR